MARPAQVQAMIDQSKEIQEQLLAEQNAPQTPDPQTPPEDQPPVEPPVTYTKDEYDRLEQKYRTLQGMHAADNSRSRTEITALQHAYKDLENRLIEYERQPPAAAPGKYVTDTDMAEWGDSIEVMRRAAREEAEATSAQREAKLYERIAELENRLGDVQRVVPKLEEFDQHREYQAKSSFWDAINTYVPNWQTINSDDKFKAWLVAEDPITGTSYQQFLSQAQANLDAPRVISIFKAWEREAAGGQTPAPKTRAQQQLEAQVAPGTSKGAGTPAQPEARIWTSADIRQFYKDCQDGKYPKGSAERTKLEADIVAAGREGRYKP